jgi:hypothetical protein
MRVQTSLSELAKRGLEGEPLFEHLGSRPKLFSDGRRSDPYLCVW